ncbi:MAG: RNA polymerase sigma factor [Gammaproteobacteria bacterium]
MSVEDARSFVDTLARTHGEGLRRFLTSRVRNVADVQDIIQEVFLRMLRIPNREAIRSPEAYLFTVALHVAQQHAMRESARPPSVELGEFLRELQGTSDNDPALRANAEQQFVRAIESLSPRARAVFILHRQHGLTLAQISQELGISFPMAKKYLVQALFQFRRQLDGNE